MASGSTLKGDGGKAVWKKMDVPYLYRYVPKGTYYMRGRFGGEPVRLCLQTDDYSLAVDKLDAERAKLKLQSRAQNGRVAESLAVALADLGTLLGSDPSLKAGTRRLYRETLARMRAGTPYAPPTGALARLCPRQMAAWWSRVADKYAPYQANQMLMLVRRALKTARRSLPFLPDPTAELKPVRIRRTRLDLLSRTQFDEVVADLRKHRQGKGSAAADYVEFMAYSGCRPGEIRHIEWRDVDDAAGVIRVWGGPDRTKNGDMRMVPIIPRMTPLLSAMREKSGGIGNLFGGGPPRRSLHAALVRCGLHRQRIYDLRHLFATTCLESGVDVPTISVWLGHKDGGSLAMKTYVQNRNEHRDRMAAKVIFG